MKIQRKKLKLKKMDQRLIKGSQKKCLDDHVCQKWDILELQK